MSRIYILDACALIALLADEDGADVVQMILRKASAGKDVVVMNKLNLLEVYYDLYRTYGKPSADGFLNATAQSPIRVQSQLNEDVFLEAGRLKATYRISLADSIALAEALTSGGSLLTCDHHEFDGIAAIENIDFAWIR